jgi:hypothetical protein
MGKVKKQDLVFGGEPLHKVKPNRHGLLDPVNTDKNLSSFSVYPIRDLEAADLSNTFMNWLGRRYHLFCSSLSL